MGKREKAFKVFERERFRCAYCGRQSSRCTLEVDHIFPKCKGGPDHEWNLAAACERCNGGKNGSVPESLPDALRERIGTAWDLLRAFDALELKLVGIGTYAGKIIPIPEADQKQAIGLLANNWRDEAPKV